jgi:hypothetical protein
MDILKAVKYGLDIVGIGAFLAPEAARIVGSLGALQDEITVHIRGGPRSNTKALFRLAASIAFGKVLRMVPAGGAGNPLPPPGMMGVMYHLENREVTFILRMNQSVITATAFSGVDTLANLPVYAGPVMTAKGADMDFRPPVFGAPPGLIIPPFGYKGKTLLTADPDGPDTETGIPGPTKNHRPSGDARSRGSLVRMLTAALASPAEVGPSTFVLPDDTNRFTGG